MTETVVTPSPGDIPAVMGTHQAIHMNTPEPAPAEAGVKTGDKPTVDVVPTAGIPAMPATGVEKFYDATTGAYNWEGHATETEYKLSQRPEPATPAGEEFATDAVSDAGLDFDVLRGKILDNGNIDESDFVALEGIGMPREIVQEYVDLATAHGARRVSEVETALGGDMGAVTAWATANLTQAERDGYDVMLNSDNWEPAAATLRNQMGMSPLQAQPQGAIIQAPNAASPGAGTEQPFASQDELNRAIADKQYKTDPQYRANVLMRASKSHYANSGSTGAHGH